METNQFYVSGTILKSRAVSYGEEHLYGASQGAGGGLGSDVSARRSVGTETKPRAMVDVIQGDIFLALWACAKRKLKVLFLNVRNHSRAGGGVRTGACNQEEELFFRCSDISLHLSLIHI